MTSPLTAAREEGSPTGDEDPAQPVNTLKKKKRLKVFVRYSLLHKAELTLGWASKVELSFCCRERELYQVSLVMYDVQE